jgi:hypothetical protein
LVLWLTEPEGLAHNTVDVSLLLPGLPSAVLNETYILIKAISKSHVLAQVRRETPRSHFAAIKGSPWMGDEVQVHTWVCRMSDEHLGWLNNRTRTDNRVTEMGLTCV